MRIIPPAISALLLYFNPKTFPILTPMLEIIKVITLISEIAT